LRFNLFVIPRFWTNNKYFIKNIYYYFFDLKLYQYFYIIQEIGIKWKILKIVQDVKIPNLLIPEGLKSKHTIFVLPA
jgi:hypothetical protein